MYEPLTALMTIANDIDVTDNVRLTWIDDAVIYVHCTHGKARSTIVDWPPDDFQIGDDRRYPAKCPECGRRLYIIQTTKVFEVRE